jgi:predicted small lipoprotein YifL
VKCTSGLNSKLLALVVLAAALPALGACGRKSGLDLPPSASVAPAGQQTSPTDPNAKTGAAAAQSNMFSPANVSDRTQYAPKLPPKRILIDPILD